MRNDKPAVEMSLTGKPLAEADVAALERRLGYSLPQDYRAFLLRHNGGRATPSEFEVPGWHHGRTVANDFNGILPGFNDLEEDLRALDGRIPKGFLPFANDPGGNSILIGLDGKQRGKIFFWDHEAEPPTGGDRLEDYPNMYFVANDFATFLQGLSDRPARGARARRAPPARASRAPREKEEAAAKRRPASRRAMSEHPALDIRRGDTVADVRRKLGLATDPTPLDPADGPGTYFHLSELGFWVFFDQSGAVYSIRFDAPFPHAVEGIHIGATRDEVRKVRGKPDRLHPVTNKERSLYDKPSFLRVDFDPETSRVERIFR